MIQSPQRRAALLADEGVYRMTKEIQLVKPDQFFDLYPPQLTENLIQMAETFLARCLKPVTDLEMFDDLCLAEFNSNTLKLDLERTVCTSANARKHIYRAYYQIQLLVLASFRDAALTMDT